MFSSSYSTRRPLPYVAAIAAGLVVILVAYLIVRPDSESSAGGSSVSYGLCGSQPTPISVAVSPEKRDVMGKLAEKYNTSSRRFDGRCARVEVFTESSGDLASALAAPWNPAEHGGRPMPQVVSPASSEWLRLLASRKAPVHPVNLGKHGRPPSVAKSPLVLAMPEPMAKALGGQLGWADLLQMAGQPQWWATKGHPDWGDVKLGKTNPEYSTSGLHATLATYLAAAAAQRVTLDESTVDNEQIREHVRRVERSMVHYGETTLTFLTNLALADERGRGLNYVSAVAVEEKSVYDYNQGRPAGDLSRPAAFSPKVPLVAVYPREGTYVSDNPYAILSSATDDEQAGARDFLSFLLEPAQQDEFRAAGFRGADGKLSGSLAPGHGLRTDAVITQLASPAPAVLGRVIDSWRSLRKPARVLIALDVSGSMAEDPFDKSATPRRGQTKLDLAKTAAKRALDLFGPHDQVGLWSFSGDRSTGLGAHTERVPIGPFAPEKLRKAIDALQPELSTALYTTIRDAHDVLAKGAGPDTITAVVVLTDGRNEWERDNDLKALRRHVDVSGREYPVRVFSVAYGRDADHETLTAIARSAGGWNYDATDVRSLDKVMREVISNF